VTTKYHCNFRISYVVILSRIIVLCFRQVVKELLDLVNQDRTAVGSVRPQPVLEPGIQRHLSQFSLITHSFGMPAMVAALTGLQSYLTEMVKCVDKLHPQATSSSSGHDVINPTTKHENGDENRS